MEKKLQELKRRLAEVADLQNAAAMLSWDQQTYMPPGGAEARGNQLGTLSSIAHRKFVSDEMGQLLEDLESYTDELDPDSDEARLIQVVRRNFDKKTKVDRKSTRLNSSHYS